MSRRTTLTLSLTAWIAALSLGLPFATGDARADRADPVRAAARRHPPKELDLLAYLYPSEAREAVARAAGFKGWRVEILDSFTDEFTELLARSKVFVSGFGQGFYEALALGSFPVAWPLSPLHEADARAFFKAAGLPAALAESEAELIKVASPLIARDFPSNRLLSDGTEQLVREIELLAKGVRDD